MKQQKATRGGVLLINPSEDDMEIEENPRKRRRRRRKSGSKTKRRAHKRSNPAPKRRRRRRSNPVAAARSNPPRRRRRRRSSARRAHRRSYRRNPKMPPWKSMGIAAVGGAGARGLVMLTDKIPAKNPYLALAIKGVTPFVGAIGAGFLGFDRLCLGAAGYGGGQAVDVIQAVYNVYKAKQAAQGGAKAPGPQGFGSIRSLPGGSGVGSIRMGRQVAVTPR